jgi:hypothetical protein
MCLHVSLRALCKARRLGEVKKKEIAMHGDQVEIAANLLQLRDVPYDC